MHICAIVLEFSVGQKRLAEIDSVLNSLMECYNTPVLVQSSSCTGLCVRLKTAVPALGTAGRTSDAMHTAKKCAKHRNDAQRF